jgi:hypothetical protein
MNSARIVISALIFIFLMDAINVDILYAAMQGDMLYSDNPAIVDSALDTNTAQFYQASSVHRDIPAKVSKCAILHGHIVFEDVDSPTVLECDNTATLLGECFLYPDLETVSLTSDSPVFDRPITFLQLRI